MNIGNFVNESPQISVFIIVVLFIIFMTVMHYGHSIIVSFINRNKPAAPCCDTEDDDNDEF